MDLVIAALIFIIVSVAGLIRISVPPKPLPPPPALVKCPKCSAGSLLKDIACANCGNKKLSIKAANIQECPDCGIPPPELLCPKCGCDLTVLLLKKHT